MILVQRPAHAEWCRKSPCTFVTFRLTFFSLYINYLSIFTGKECQWKPGWKDELLVPVFKGKGFDPFISVKCRNLGRVQKPVGRYILPWAHIHCAFTHHLSLKINLPNLRRAMEEFSLFCPRNRRLYVRNIIIRNRTLPPDSVGLPWY